MTDVGPDDRWRQAHLGHWLGLALRRFDARVLQLALTELKAGVAA